MTTGCGLLVGVEAIIIKSHEHLESFQILKGYQPLSAIALFVAESVPGLGRCHASSIALNRGKNDLQAVSQNFLTLFVEVWVSRVSWIKRHSIRMMSSIEMVWRRRKPPSISPHHLWMHVVWWVGGIGRQGVAIGHHGGNRVGVLGGWNAGRGFLLLLAGFQVVGRVL